jgi:hypothetical protein
MGLASPSTQHEADRAAGSALDLSPFDVAIDTNVRIVGDTYES